MLEQTNDNRNDEKLFSRGGTNVTAIQEVGGWAALTAKYNAGLSLTLTEITEAAPFLALVEK
jgi:hypothetical protein